MCILQGRNLRGHLGILPTTVCESPISQMLKQGLRSIMQLAQGHRRTGPGFRQVWVPQAQERMLCNTRLSPDPALLAFPTHSLPSIPQLHLKVLTWLIAMSREVQVAAPVPDFVLQPLKLLPVSRDQKGTEQVPVPLSGATFV